MRDKMAKKKVKQEVETKSDNSDLFNKATTLINSKYGMEVIESLTVIKDKPIVGVSSGSLGLDWIISSEIGGMEAGKVLELWGDYSTGKTTLALQICANVNAMGRRAVFLDAEGSFRWPLALSVGCKEELFFVIDKLSARESANVAKSLIQTGEVGVLVIDSVAAWRPEPEGKKSDDDPDFTKDKIAAHSLFLSQTIPLLSSWCKQHGTILVLINQARVAIGSYKGGLKPFGGKAEEHQNSVRIALSGTGAYTSARIVDGAGTIVGQWVTCYCDKNKIDMPFREIKIPLILGKGVNPFLEVEKLATEATGVISNGGGFYKWADDPDSPAMTRGQAAFVQLLHDDLDLFNKVKSRVIEALGIKYSDTYPQINPFLIGR